MEMIHSLAHTDYCCAHSVESFEVIKVRPISLYCKKKKLYNRAVF